ncbi:MAG: DUF1499 domain-containing protein [Pseudomonadota bacterium]
MQKKSWRQRIRQLGIRAAWISVILVVIAGPGHRFGILPVKAAIYTFAASALIAALAVLLLIVAAIMKRSDGDAGWTGHLIALVLAGAIAVQFGLGVSKARAVPPIHDITTDTVDPPEFKALAGARAGSPNPIEYAGQAVAEQQRDAYPDIQTIRLAQTPKAVLDAAESAAGAQGWTVVRIDADNQLEATATTSYFGFKDDVIVRARSDGSGTVLDIRSKSRVGISDVGANAARIRLLRDNIQNILSAQ